MGKDGKSGKSGKSEEKKVHPGSRKHWVHGKQPNGSAKRKEESQKTCTKRPTPMRKQQYHVKLEYSSGLTS